MKARMYDLVMALIGSAVGLVASQVHSATTITPTNYMAYGGNLG